MASGGTVHITILSQKSPRAVVLKTMITDGMGERAVVEVLGINELLKIEHGYQTDVCIVDLMSSENTVSATLARIRKVMPNTAIIALHIYSTAELVQPLIDQGVDGYLTYDPSRHELIGSISDVAAGKKYLPVYIK